MYSLNSNNFKHDFTLCTVWTQPTLNGTLGSVQSELKQLQTGLYAMYSLYSNNFKHDFTLCTVWKQTTSLCTVWTQTTLNGTVRYVQSEIKQL